MSKPMLESTLTEKQHLENERRKNDLIDFIGSGQAILMAGAGCSAPIYPAWPDFIKLLQEKALERDSDFNEDPKDFLPFADKVKECLGSKKYYSLIFSTFKPTNPPHFPYHEQLCKLPFKGITTTNYDLILESALNKVAPGVGLSLHFEGSTETTIHEFLMSLNAHKATTRKVAHLHGIYDIEASIVLSETEYEHKYGFKVKQPEESLFEKIADGMSKEEFQQALLSYGYEWPLRRKLLWSLLATRRIVFIGFGMGDPYFRKMLEEIKTDLSTYYTESHYLVLRITEKDKAETIDFAKMLKTEYGIQTIFYLDEENDYSGLAKFIGQIDDIISPAKPSVNRIKEDEKIITTGNINLTDKLMAIAKNQQLNED